MPHKTVITLFKLPSLRTSNIPKTKKEVSASLRRLADTLILMTPGYQMMAL